MKGLGVPPLFWQSRRVSVESHYDRRRRLNCLTLEDVAREKLSVDISCKACGRRRVVAPEPLIRLCLLRRWPMAFHKVSEHLRCGECGAKNTTVTASGEPPEGSPLGPANVIEFNLLRRKLRD